VLLLYAIVVKLWGLRGNTPKQKKPSIIGKLISSFMQKLRVVSSGIARDTKIN